MTPWMAATIVLVPAFAIPALAACRGSTAERLVELVRARDAVTAPVLQAHYAKA